MSVLFLLKSCCIRFYCRSFFFFLLFLNGDFTVDVGLSIQSGLD